MPQCGMNSNNTAQANIETPKGTHHAKQNIGTELWDMRDLAAHLKLCNRSTRSLVKKGLIPTIKLTGKALRFNPRAVEAALQKLTVGGAA